MGYAIINILMDKFEGDDTNETRCKKSSTKPKARSEIFKEDSN